MVKVKLYGNNTVLETVAFCDEASSVTLVDKSIGNRLGLDGTPQPLCIQWTNNLSSRHKDSSCLKFKISGVFSGAKIFSMKNVRTVKNLALPVQEIQRSDWERYSHLEGIPFHEISKRPMISLGQDNIHLTVARKVTQSTENEPIATKTNLGWILHGGNSIEQEKQAYSFHICSSEISDISLHEMVKQSFTTDAFGVVPKKTNINKAEARAIDIMESSYFSADLLKGGRCEYLYNDCRTNFLMPIGNYRISPNSQCRRSLLFGVSILLPPLIFVVCGKPVSNGSESTIFELLVLLYAEFIAVLVQIEAVSNSRRFVSSDFGIFPDDDTFDCTSRIISHKCTFESFESLGVHCSIWNSPSGLVGPNNICIASTQQMNEKLYVYLSGYVSCGRKSQFPCYVVD
ncbi:hypothetical protein JTB14_030701 [Gonioctena quinquepunctata]|nr:hypothetical protein JTB14_030701 [Gonioctena quinquepunctata]